MDALWLSPIYPSPLADMGYDVADHCAIAPELGDLDGFDRLVARAHELGLKVLLDFVPSHTSIEHPWFREHPEYYVWADEPPNNWVAAFGGPAWTLDEETGRYYLHSFYPEQPDLDWRVPEVREAMGDVLRFWVDRGVDGFRVDALQQLMKDPELRDDPLATTPFALPLGDEYGRLEHVHSEAGPEIGVALQAMREAAGDALLVGEVYRPTRDLGPYLEHLDLAFAFELLHAPFDEERLAEVVAEGQRMGRVAWALSNHDFPRLATRFGEENAARAAEFLLSLARDRVPLPGGRDRDGGRRGGGSAVRPRGPRLVPPPHAVGARAARRLHDRRAMAGLDRPRATGAFRPSAASKGPPSSSTGD